jgi:prolyl-tRNA synthetase
MKYTHLKIQTQREAPNNATTQGFAFLVRAGYLTRENELLPLGQEAITRLRKLSDDPSFLSLLSIPTVGNEQETYFPLSSGDTEIIHCPSCQYTTRLELAAFEKNILPTEDELPLEKLLTPDCSTIESLANFLNVPKEKTAKALMYTRIAEDQFIFVVVRGDMQLSEAKLKNLVGDVRAATAEEIIRAGAVPGYASPIGLKNALIIVDDLIPKSQNLVAGANDAGYHFKNTNYPRDYAAETVADLTLARAGDSCIQCGTSLSAFDTLELATRSGFNLENILLALAETHHDEKGLTLPKSAAPYDVYLMHIPGKQLDTHAEAEKIHEQLKNKGVSVLFDDRDERAGVKFNDADLIGCPLRVTVGEKALQSGMVELKQRKEQENQLIPLEELADRLK